MEEANDPISVPDVAPDVDVLVAGAGPTGLTLACVLLRAVVLVRPDGYVGVRAMDAGAVEDFLHRRIGLLPRKSAPAGQRTDQRASSSSRVGVGGAAPSGESR